MDASDVSGDVIAGFLFGYLIAVLVSYIRSRRHNEAFDFIGASAIGAVVMAAVANFLFLGSINAFEAGTLLFGLQLLGFLPIFIIALPLAMLSRRSARVGLKVSAALGAFVACVVTIYLFSGACLSGICRYIFPGKLGGNPITDQYQTEPWLTYTDSAGGFKIEYPPEVVVSESYPTNSTSPTAERVVEFTMSFSDNQPLGTPPITLDINHNPNGAVGAQQVNSCGAFRSTPCTPYASSQPVSISGNPAALSFLTDGTFRYLSVDLKGKDELVDFNVQLPFDAYDPTKAPKPADDATVQDIFTKMISTFEFTTPFDPSTSSHPGVQSLGIKLNSRALKAMSRLSLATIQSGPRSETFDTTNVGVTNRGGAPF